MPSHKYILITLLLSLMLAAFVQNLRRVQNVFTSPNNYPALEVAYSPDGSLLAVALQYKVNSIKILEADSGREVASLVGHTYGVNSVAFSPDGSFLASGSNDNTVKIWRTADFSLVDSLKGHGGYVYSVAFSPAGDFLASGSVDETVKIWRTTDFSLVASLEEHTWYVNSVAFSPAGDFLASGSNDNTVKIWRTTDFSLVASLEEHTSYVRSVAFSPAGDFLASGSNDNTVKIWRTTDFSLVESLEEYTNGVNSVAFSPAGDFLASGSWDNTVKIWYVNDSYSLHRTIAGANGGNYWIPSVAFHPAGTSLAVANNSRHTNRQGVVSLWGTPSRQAVFCPAGCEAVQYASVTINSTEGARLSINGQAIPERGAGVFTTELEAGSYSIRAEKDGYISSSEQLDIVLGQANIFSLPLVPTPPEPSEIALQIIAPQQGSSANSTSLPLSLALQGQVSDLLFSIDNQSIASNYRDIGVIHATGAARQVHLQLDLPANLRQGQEFRLSVVASGAAGLSQPVHLDLRYQGPEQAKRELFFVAAGLNSYKDSDIRPLRFAAVDALELAAVFAEQAPQLYDDFYIKVLFTDDNPQHLLQRYLPLAHNNNLGSGSFGERLQVFYNRDSTDGRMRGIIDTILQQAGPEDTVVISISGHGVNNGGRYYIPFYATQLKEGLAGSSLQSRDLLEPLAATQSQVVIILDTCYSGASLSGFFRAPSEAQLSSPVAFARQLRDIHVASAEIEGNIAEKNVLIVTSTSADELAVEEEYWGNGALVETMLEYLRYGGTSGGVSILEMMQYVSKGVTELTHGQQTPTMSFNGSDFTLLYPRHRR